MITLVLNNYNFHLRLFLFLISIIILLNKNTNNRIAKTFKTEEIIRQLSLNIIVVINSDAAEINITIT